MTFKKHILKDYKLEINFIYYCNKMASPETSREYSQDNKKENFSSQEAEKVLKETKDELSSLKLDIFNKSSKNEIKGWDINELEKASELI